nr:unnamed protein product [Spirometra erinaceieuropaei]
MDSKETSQVFNWKVEQPQSRKAFVSSEFKFVKNGKPTSVNLNLDLADLERLTSAFEAIQKELEGLRKDGH